MTLAQPTTEIDARYSSEGATATPWEDARQVLDTASICWFTSVRSDGRPHVTPLHAVWHNGAMHLCTGAHEQKAKNLAANPRCSLVTGTNTIDGLDIVVEGVAERVEDAGALQELADAWGTHHGEQWAFEVVSGGFKGEAGNVAMVYRIAPVTAYGFGKGDVFSHTRWTF